MLEEKGTGWTTEVKFRHGRTDVGMITAVHSSGASISRELLLTEKNIDELMGEAWAAARETDTILASERQLAENIERRLNEGPDEEEVRM